VAIVITQGDKLSVTLTCPSTTLTGATLTTVFPKSDGTTISIANSAHTLANQTTNVGQFSIALTATETAAMPAGPNQSFYTKVDVGTTITHFHGHGILTVKQLPFP
jgi:uncharacterized protein (DUF4213/DUF364 family)